MVGHKRHRPSANRLSLESLEPRRLLAADFPSTAALSQLEGFEEARIEQVGTRTSFLGLQVETTGFARSQAGSSADAFLTTNQATLGLPNGAVRELEARFTKHGLATSHVGYQQVSGGLDVLGGEVSVHFDDHGTVTTVHNHYRDVAVPTDQVPTFPVEQAIQLAEQHAGVTQTFGTANYELAWWPQEDGSADLVWDIMVFGYAPFGNFQTRVHAETGELINQTNVAAAATGSGFAYESNPFQMQGNGVGLSDNSDATSPALQAQLRSVELQGLDPDTGYLVGDYVDLASIQNPLYPTPLADEPSRVYEYDRDDPRFEQVNIYYGVDRVQRYIQSLGFSDDTNNGIRDYPTYAIAHFGDFQNAFYSFVPNEDFEVECPNGGFCDMIVFGDGAGGIDLAEDMDVVLHEYGHAIQHDQNPRWGGGEMGAMGEGFSDYLAASFLADVGDPEYLAAHAAAIGEWSWFEDSFQYPPSLRRVDGAKIYPDDLVGQVHADGEIWSAALWDIRAEIGSDVLDPILLESHFSLPGEALMRDGANAIIDADLAINGGTNQAVLQYWFEERGILAPPPPDDHGNSFDVATEITVPSATEAVIETVADVDYFSFVAQAGFTYEFEIQLGSLSDSFLVLFDTDGETNLEADNNGGTDLGSLITWTAPTSGTYFLRGDNFSNQTGSYTLDVRLDSFEDDFEDNDFIAQATPLVGGDQSIHQLTIDAPGDDDFFRLMAATDGTLDIDILFDNDQGNLDLEVLDSNGSVLTSSTSDDNNEHLSLPALEGEVFYVRVFGHAGAIQEDYSLVIDAPGDADLFAFDFDITEDLMGFDRFGPGEMIEVYYDFENLGDSAVVGDNYELGFYLSVDDDIDPGSDWFVGRAAGVDLTPSPGAGAIHSDTVPLTLPDFSSPFWNLGQDVYYLGMFLDDLQSQDELLEDNNSLWDDFELVLTVPEDHLEQDDTILEATQYAPGEDISEHGLTIDMVGDDDYFRIASIVDGTVDISVDFLHDQGNVDVELLDDTDTVIASSTSLDDNEQISADVFAGREYTIRVFAAGLETSFGYSLTADLPEIPADFAEENDSFETAYSLPSEDQTVTDLNIDSATDQDFFRWVSGGVGSVSIDLAFEHAVGGDIQLFVYDTNMQPVADSQTMDDNESVLIEELAVGDEFFIQVLTDLNMIGALELAAHPGYSLTLDGPAPPLSGDFNLDGNFDCADIDALVAVSASGVYDPNYDLDGDFRVNRADTLLWLELAGAAPDSPTGGAPFLVGDADLNGYVDGQDYVTWNINKFTSNPSWCAGDFTADGNIDGQDFVAWNINKFTAAGGASLTAPLSPPSTPVTEDELEHQAVLDDRVSTPAVPTPVVDSARPHAQTVIQRRLIQDRESETVEAVDQVFSQAFSVRWADRL